MSINDPGEQPKTARLLNIIPEFAPTPASRRRARPQSPRQSRPSWP